MSCKVFLLSCSTCSKQLQHSHVKLLTNERKRKEKEDCHDANFHPKIESWVTSTIETVFGWKKNQFLRVGVMHEWAFPARFDWKFKSQRGFCFHSSALSVFFFLVARAFSVEILKAPNRKCRFRFIVDTIEDVFVIEMWYSGLNSVSASTIMSAKCVSNMYDDYYVNVDRNQNQYFALEGRQCLPSFDRFSSLFDVCFPWKSCLPLSSVRHLLECCLEDERQWKLKRIRFQKFAIRFSI